MGYVVALVVAVGMLTGAYFAGYSAGAESRNPEIIALQTAIETSKELAKQAEAKAKEVQVKVETVYVDRIRKVVEKAPAEIQLVEVIKREVDPNCSMPASYRSLWNGTSSPGDSAGKDPQVLDDSPVPLADLAESTRKARESFNLNTARLQAWQELAIANNWSVVDNQ